MTDTQLIARAVALAVEHSTDGIHGPFGAVVARNGAVIGEGWNSVVSLKDPTAHAEIMAIRNACKHLGAHILGGCTIYASCEPCPMCLAAIHWARLDRIVYACSRHDAAEAGFDDMTIRHEVVGDSPDPSIPRQQLGRDASLEAFAAWQDNPDKVMY
jgi:guanine deaminase